MIDVYTSADVRTPDVVSLPVLDTRFQCLGHVLASGSKLLVRLNILLYQVEDCGEASGGPIKALGKGVRRRNGALQIVRPSRRDWPRAGLAGPRPCAQSPLLLVKCTTAASAGFFPTPQPRFCSRAGQRVRLLRRPLALLARLRASFAPPCRRVASSLVETGNACVICPLVCRPTCCRHLRLDVFYRYRGCCTIA